MKTYISCSVLNWAERIRAVLSAATSVLVVEGLSVAAFLWVRVDLSAEVPEMKCKDLCRLTILL